jgi:glycosyltransferase involved in cell wall biosynthesis
MAEAARLHEGRSADDGAQVPDTGDDSGPAVVTTATTWRANPLLWPARLARRAVRRVGRKVKRWRGLVFTFPVRPLGWSFALESVVEPADVWHGMWAGSLPALQRMRRLHGGRTIYDSRDVYMLSRDFASLEWPFRPILAGLERRWAQAADIVLTVNDSYADLIERQLQVPRPPVVMNTPERWTPPDPAPDLIREATGVPAGVSVVLYQGQLATERGIEQAMDAILLVPGAVLALLGFGSREAAYRAMAASPPYADRVFLLPAVPPSDLLTWTASADIMVMPIQPTTTNHEFTTPQKLWEAIAAGVPIVASDLPGMAPVVTSHGVGIVCDPTSPAAIAAAIRRLLAAPPAERMAMRDHVLAVAHEHYTWEAQVRTLLRVYDGLTGRHTADGLA